MVGPEKEIKTKIPENKRTQDPFVRKVILQENPSGTGTATTSADIWVKTPRIGAT